MTATKPRRQPSHNDASSSDERSGYSLPAGTYDDACAMVGTRTQVRFGEAEVSWAQVKQFCAMTHDGNASFWDQEFARREWGGIVAPPAMLWTWLMPIEWRPDQPAPVPLLTAQVPLPGDTLVNVSNDTEFLLPVRVGDHLNVVEELVSVSPEKSTRLGVGHFVTTLSTFRRGDGAVIARMTNVLFRFRGHQEPE